MTAGFTVNTSRVDGFEGFREAVHGSHVDVMQLQQGQFRGSLTHIGVGDFSLSVGSFSVGIRTQRISTDPKLIVGMLLASENRVTHWSYDMDPGDVLVIPPGVEHDGRFHGAASYAAMRLDLADVASVFRGEAWMSDPENWCNRNRYRADPRLGALAAEKLRMIVSRLADPDVSMSREAADFWRRAIIDVITTTVMEAQPSDIREPMPQVGRLISERRALHRRRRRQARAYFRDLRGVPRVAPDPSPCIPRGVRLRPGHVPSAEAVMRRPFCASRQRSADNNDRGSCTAARLPQPQPVFRLLSFAVRRISVRDVRKIASPMAPVAGGTNTHAIEEIILHHARHPVLVRLGEIVCAFLAPPATSCRDIRRRPSPATHRARTRPDWI